MPMKELHAGTVIWHRPTRWPQKPARTMPIRILTSPDKAPPEDAVLVDFAADAQAPEHTRHMISAYSMIGGGDKADLAD